MSPKADPLAFLFDIFKEIDEETRTKVGERFYTRSEHYSNWIDIIRDIVRHIPREEQFASLVAVRLYELNRQLPLMLANVTYVGAYHECVREFRYIMESFSQAYYLGMKYPRADIGEKLHHLRQIEREVYGYRLIRRLEFSQSKALLSLRIALAIRA